MKPEKRDVNCDAIISRTIIFTATKQWQKCKVIVHVSSAKNRKTKWNPTWPLNITISSRQIKQLRYSNKFHPENKQEQHYVHLPSVRPSSTTINYSLRVLHFEKKEQTITPVDKTQ